MEEDIFLIYFSAESQIWALLHWQGFEYSHAPNNREAIIMEVLVKLLLELEEEKK